MNAIFTLVLIGLGQSMLDVDADFVDMTVNASSLSDAKMKSNAIAKFKGMEVCVLCQELRVGEKRLSA